MRASPANLLNMLSMNKLTTAILLFTSLFLFNRCANQATPTGGPKDETSPKLVNTIPLNKSLNYTGKRIELAFDEFIQIENLKQELIITPAVDEDYEYETRRNNISILFKNSLQPNTTYTFNFRNAIKDITEKNVAENAKLVFSTGDVLDSLFIKGLITDVLTGEPSPDVLVMLHVQGDTVDITSGRPYYFTKTDTGGNYALENLRQNTYKLYALQERNNSLKYDQEKEKIAFLDEPISLDSNYNQVNLSITEIDRKPPNVIRTGSDRNNAVIELNEGLAKVNLTLLNRNDSLAYQLKLPDAKSITLFNTINQYDSLPVVITATDSTDNVQTDTIRVKFTQPKEQKGKVAASFNVSTDPKSSEKILKDFTYTLKFSKPVGTYDLSKIQLLADTTDPIPVDSQLDFRWNKYQNELTLRKQLTIDTSVQVRIPAGSFMSVEQDSSQAIKTTHELKEESDYGSISGTVITDEQNFIVQLLSSDYKVIKEIRNRKNYDFTFLEAGEYRIRVIMDRNGNGKWDAGDVEKRVQPERVKHFDGTLKLKQNFDLTGNDISL